MVLTDIEIRSAKAVEKPIKLFDGGGLYLLVKQNGSRWWRFKYRFQGKGACGIAEITAPELLAALRTIESRGRHETAHRTKQRVGQIFRYAIATGRAERDIAVDLRRVLTPVVTKNHAAITDPIAIGHLLRAIDGYCGQPATHAALKLAPLVFVRPGELRQAEWSEINLDTGEWRIPAQRMKMREPHIVPLSKQAVEILRGLHSLTCRSRYVFPSLACHWPPNVRKHNQRRAASPWICDRRNDWSRLPGDGIDLPQ